MQLGTRSVQYNCALQNLGSTQPSCVTSPIESLETRWESSDSEGPFSTSYGIGFGRSYLGQVPPSFRALVLDPYCHEETVSTQIRIRRQYHWIGNTSLPTGIDQTSQLTMAFRVRCVVQTVENTVLG